MTLSIKMMSDKMLSVIVGEGYWYAPVYIQVLIPSCSNALAFIKRAFNDLANPSVPNNPTTEVIPAFTSSLNWMGGVRY